jgi:DNA polymerase-1
MTEGLGNVQLELVNTVDKAAELMQWLSEQKVIAVDTETTGLSPETDRVRLVQIGGHDRGWSIPWHWWGGVFTDVVQRFEGEYVMHHGKFDRAMIIASDGPVIPIERIHDTMIAAHVLRPDLPVGLKPLSARNIDPRAAMASEALDAAMHKAGWTWATVPIDFEMYWAYGALDAVLTYRNDEIVRPEVMADAPKAYDLERSVAWVVSDMERYGARVDVAYAQEKLDAFTKYSDDVAQWIMNTYGVRAGSQQAVAEVFIKELGLHREEWPRTAGGKLSLTKEILDAIDHPLAKALRQKKQVDKVGGTYLKNFIDLSISGIIHPNINPLGFSERKMRGVRTSRMSMSNPNLQNLPRRDDSNPVAETVRNCVIAREDQTLVMVDFDQIEYRLIASLSPDDKLRDAFLDPEDFFTILTRDVFGDPSIQKKDPRRQSVKNSAYALAYGAGQDKFARTAGVAGVAAEEFLARFNQTFSGVRWLQNQVSALATQRYADEGIAYVRSPMTQRRMIGDRGKEYAITNYLIQGYAAEVFKTKLVEAASAGLGPYMVAPVHDEIVLDVPNDVLDDVIVTLRDIMNDSELLGKLPITAGCSTGARWGEKKDVEWPTS